MAYLSSANVKVYPCAYRGTNGTNLYDPEARLTSEKNLTSLINAFGARYVNEGQQNNHASFVISWNNPTIKFVISGYIFEVNLTGQLTGNDIYAHIKVNDRHIPTEESEATDWKCTSLVNIASSTSETLDDNNTFGGLLISNEPTPTGVTITDTLHLLEYNSAYSRYNVPASSFARVSSYYVGQATLVGNELVYYPIDAAFRTASLTAENATVTGTLRVTGATTLSSTLAVTGNATVGGTLGVTGNTTIGGTLGVTGNTTIGGTLGVTGNVSVNTDKFIVNAANGNTTIGGTLAVAGATTLNDAASTVTKLNHNSNSETILENSYFAFGGSYQSANNGFIDSAGNAAFLGTNGVATDKLMAGNATNITLASNLTKSDDNLKINSRYITFEGNYQTNIPGGLILGSATGASAGQLHASADITTSTDFSGRDLYLGPNGSVSTIKTTSSVGRLECKSIRLNHANTGDEEEAAIDLKAKYISTAATSITLTGGAVYSIVFINANGASPDPSYNASGILSLPNVEGLTQIRAAADNGHQYSFFASRSSGSDTWTITYAYSGGQSYSGKWYVTKLCKLTTTY